MSPQKLGFWRRTDESANDGLPWTLKYVPPGERLAHTQFPEHRHREVLNGAFPGVFTFCDRAGSIQRMRKPYPRLGATYRF